ncbi:MAG: hypothetical protein AB1486_33860 [Planctomycetota bacterium]
MKQTCTFVKAVAIVTCEIVPGRTISVPVIPGILKHPRVEELQALLANPNVVTKYTLEALRKASWPILRQFPRAWLRECLPHAHLKPSRRRALEFLLS